MLFRSLLDPDDEPEIEESFCELCGIPLNPVPDRPGPDICEDCYSEDNNEENLDE